MLCRAGSRRLIHGIKIGRGAPAISHLLFADDLLFFCHAQLSEAEVIWDILQQYGAWSGQILNVRKSSISFSRGIRPCTVSQLCSLFHLIRNDRPEKHLGLPLVLGSNRKQVFEELSSKVRQRIPGWKMKTLSQAGRLVLIRTVAVSLPAYTMANYLIPKSICSSLDSLFMRFWWGVSDLRPHAFILISWASIGRPNSLGGLGLTLMESLNRIWFTKMGWLIQSNSDQLWIKALRAKYMKHPLIWVAGSP